MALDPLIRGLSPLERKIIPHLKEGTRMRALAKEAGLQEVEAMRALQWLENKKVVSLKHETSEQATLDENGKTALKRGLPERALLEAIEKEAGDVQTIARHAKTSKQEAGAALGILKKRGWATLEKGILTITAQGKKALKEETPEEQLIQKLKEPTPIEKLKKQERETLKELQKRKALVKIIERRDRTITLTETGKKLVKADLGKPPAERLTPQDLKEGTWRDKEYRAFDVTINVPTKAPGKEHFVNEAIRHIKQVWLELGFKEMRGSLTQSAFWNLDALFIPQDHPAREMQDTFYLKETTRADDKEAYDRVKAAHEDGGDTGSTGWRYSFERAEAEKTLLRTHNTALSAKTLRAIGKGEKEHGKYFAVGPVFRNEDLDWKHLFEFHQVEGIVVDPDANFRHLLGYLKLFFKKLGYTDVRIRPAHFPYTEPSAEVDGWHPIKKEWVELGGAGLFRPEVTKSLIGEETPVLAWGLGLERSITEYFNITDLRALYNNDLEQLRTIKKWMK